MSRIRKRGWDKNKERLFVYIILHLYLVFLLLSNLS